MKTEPLTPLERLVKGSESLTRLRESGFLRLGDQATGMKWHQPVGAEGGKWITLEGNPLLPSATGKLADRLGPDLRSVLVMTARVRRDATEDPRDQRLLQALNLCLNGNDDPERFRWEWEAAERSRQRIKAERQRLIHQLKRGSARGVLLILTRLTRAEKELLEACLLDDLVRRNVLHLDDRNRPYRDAKFPRGRCELCTLPRTSRGQGHGRGDNDCHSENAYLVLDGGSRRDVLACVPESIRQLVRTVQFKIPRRTLIQPYESSVELVPLVRVFLLDQLTKEQRDHVRQRLDELISFEHEDELRQNEQHGEHSTYRRDTRLVYPTGRQELEALIISGPATKNLEWRNAIFGTSEAERYQSRQNPIPLVVTKFNWY